MGQYNRHQKPKKSTGASHARLQRPAGWDTITVMPEIVEPEDDAAEGKLSKAEMTHVRAFIQAKLDEGLSQAAVGQKVGSSQGLISRIMNKEAPHTVTIGRARTMAKAAGISYDLLTRGIDFAGRWETVDPIKLRGRALDVLSSVYDEEFLRALQDIPPPPGSDSWTLEEWHDFLSDVRKAWKSGVFAIPGMRPPKRT